MILATLVHLLGDLNLAEEAMHEAFADLNHAIQLISRHQGFKFGPWEIRPAADLNE